MIQTQTRKKESMAINKFQNNETDNAGADTQKEEKHSLFSKNTSIFRKQSVMHTYKEKEFSCYSLCHVPHGSHCRVQ